MPLAYGAIRILVFVMILLCIVVSLCVAHTLIPIHQTLYSSITSPIPIEQVDLVIAFCREDLDWIYPVAQRFRRIYIYTKCGLNIDNTVALKRLDAAFTHVRIIHLQNIGSCDFVYLTHIITEYSDLPMSIEFRVGTGDRPSRQVPYYFNYILLWSFRLNDYSFTNHTHMPFHKSPYKNLWDFSTSVLGTELTQHLLKTARYIYKGGVFIAKRTEIHKHPIEVYQRLRCTQQHANEEVDHHIERLWGLLLTCDKFVRSVPDLTQTSQLP
jgi:hypothetical protein